MFGLKELLAVRILWFVFINVDANCTLFQEKQETSRSTARLQSILLVLRTIMTVLCIMEQSISQSRNVLPTIVPKTSGVRKEFREKNRRED